MKTTTTTFAKPEASCQFKTMYGLDTINRLKTQDKPRLREAWTVFVDDLQKSGLITLRQAETWQNPFLPKKDR